MNIIEQQIQAAMELLTQAPDAQIVIATYTREEFTELRPGEDYDDFKRRERDFAEGLASRGLLGRIRFQTIDSVGYYKYLADHPQLDNSESARAAYAAELAGE